MLIKMASSPAFIPIIVVFGLVVMAATWYFINKPKKDTKEDK